MAEELYKTQRQLMSSIDMNKNADLPTAGLAGLPTRMPPGPRSAMLLVLGMASQGRI